MSDAPRTSAPYRDSQWQQILDLGDAVDERLVADAVAVTRATRTHADVRQGSSVRGAIDTVLVAEQLLLLRGEDGYRETLYDAMVVALSGRQFDPSVVQAFVELGTEAMLNA